MKKSQPPWLLAVLDHHPNKQILRTLKTCKEHLKWAWEADRTTPKSFPVNTAEAFFQFGKQLGGEPKASRTDSDLVPPPSPPPEHLFDLVDEEIIEAVFEQQNGESYKNALKLAASAGRRGQSIWRKILLAVDAAHSVAICGPHVIPKPRIHFLHRELLKMAEPLGINELTHEGIAEFLDDMCPCGIKHKPGTIRKLRKPRRGKGRAESDDF